MGTLVIYGENAGRLLKANIYGLSYGNEMATRAAVNCGELGCRLMGTYTNE